MHSPKKMGEPRNQMFLRKVQEVKKASLKSEINFSSEILSYYLNGICQEYIQNQKQTKTKWGNFILFPNYFLCICNFNERHSRIEGSLG